MGVIIIAQFILRLKSNKMRTKKVSSALNVVSSIDELIMELTYIKNGIVPSNEKLKKGIEIIENMLSLDEHPKEISAEDKSGFNPFQMKQFVYSDKYKVGEHREKLEQAKESINKIMANTGNLDKKDIEKTQELLLKISIPIWKEEVSILKPNKYKRVEL